MKNNYKQLSCEEREKIAILRAKGKTVRQIAKAIGRNPGTISRELKRNKPPKYNGYMALAAHKRAVRRKRLAAQRPLLKNKQIKMYVIKKLKTGWSPELIAGRLTKDLPEHSVSHEAIYQFIYDFKTRTKYNLIPCLARSHKRRRCRTHSHRHKNIHIPCRVSIKERPKGIQSRRQPGHWEADTIISRKSKPALAIALERKSRLIRLAKLRAKTSRNFKNALTRRLSRYPRHMRLSITFDNGCENVEHQSINKTLGTRSYFCEPYHSWEKGSIENAISLIRRFFPKKTDFDIISKEQIKRVENLLNSRPKKCLKFKTPAEIFSSSVALTG